MESFDVEGTFNDDYLWFYDTMLTPARNRAEANEIVATLGLPSGASVLDAPCGHGRIANLLAADGYRVTGVDLTELFLERARAERDELGVDVDYRQGDLRDLPVSGPFDALVCWFTSFGYFDDAENRKVLDEFARVLRPGGRLLIETMHHDGFVRSFTSAPDATVTERGSDTMTDLTTFDPVSGRIESERTVQRGGEIRTSHHSIRLPTVPELRLVARRRRIHRPDVLRPIGTAPALRQLAPRGDCSQGLTNVEPIPLVPRVARPSHSSAGQRQYRVTPGTIASARSHGRSCAKNASSAAIHPSHNARASTPSRSRPRRSRSSRGVSTQILKHNRSDHSRRDDDTPSTIVNQAVGTVTHSSS